ncbi:MAG: hypothetical protein J3Q66DRAFT_370884 [Benniella sp.]|nr:MAG: hypothetical protein J3Q66DRAFT_370884 [Benniella sp.]
MELTLVKDRKNLMVGWLDLFQTLQTVSRTRSPWMWVVAKWSNAPERDVAPCSWAYTTLLDEHYGAGVLFDSDQLRLVVDPVICFQIVDTSDECQQSKSIPRLLIIDAPGSPGEGPTLSKQSNGFHHYVINSFHGQLLPLPL